MRLFLYEHVTGGGLLDAAATDFRSLLVEAKAMVAALAEDLAACPGVEVTLLRDARLPDLAAIDCRVIDVADPRAAIDAFRRRSADADGTILLAPETDGVLAGLTRDVEAAGGTLFSPGPSFVALASNKQQTAARLAKAGLPVPEGLKLDPGARLPANCPFPAVVKPVDGAGSCGVHLLQGPGDLPPDSDGRRRVERFCAGTAASVAVLSGPAGVVALPPCAQRLSEDGRFSYLGGRLPLAPRLAARATRLARRAVAALGTPRGYVGVDLILGDAADGDGESAAGEGDSAAGDWVIEVNPRLTTSYVGLRSACRENLAAAMLDVARGESVAISFREGPLEFDADGAVRPVVRVALDV